LVEQGVGVGLVNPISARAWRGRGIAIRKFSVSIPFIVGVCQPLGRPGSRLAEHVTQLLLDECGNLREELASEHIGSTPQGARAVKLRKRQDQPSRAKPA
jgi:hypothetical protein